MKIYLARHGQTQWNQEGKMQGWKNSNLTAMGIENAKKLGAALQDVKFDAIFCTPLERTLETATYIRGDRDIPIQVNEKLKEMGFGQWEGMPHEKIKELYPIAYHNFWKQTDQYEPIEGESFQVLFQRIKEGMAEIINTQAENVLVIAHGVVIKSIYAIYKDIPLSEFWQPPYVQDTCLTIIEANEGEMKFILEADISHLEKEITS